MFKKKIKKILIGTNNKGKLKEIRDLLPKHIETVSTSTFKLKSPKENGKTFEQNSLIKSRYFSQRTKLICLAPFFSAKIARTPVPVPMSKT